MRRPLLTLLLIVLLIVLLKREGETILGLFGLDVDVWINQFHALQGWMADHLPPVRR